MTFATTKAAVGPLELPELDLPEIKGDASAASWTRSVVPSKMQPRLRRLAEQLAPLTTGRKPQAIFFGEVSPAAQPAWWLTQGVAAELQTITPARVSLLALENHPGRTKAAASPHAATDFFPIEHQAEQAAPGTFEERVEAHLQDDSAVLVHTEDALRWSELPLGLKHCAGMVLIVYSNRTHRAAVGAVQRRLARLHVPVLGAVVLDREYPIPGALYRWL